MAVKLAGIIFALLIELVSVIFTLSMEILVGVIVVQLLKGPCTSSKAGRYHPCSINKSADRYHLRTIIESH